MDMKKDRLLNGITIALLVGGTICIAYVLVKFSGMSLDFLQLGDTGCSEKSYIESYNDPYMDQIIPPQTRLKLFKNYYDCNSVKKGDLALFKYSEYVEPVVRKVVGVPGDSFDLTDLKDGFWALSINGELFPSETNPYKVKADFPPPLKTFVETGHKVLKEGEFIVISSKWPSLNDSGNYGIIKIDQLVGIAVYDL